MNLKAKEGLPKFEGFLGFSSSSEYLDFLEIGTENVSMGVIGPSIAEKLQRVFDDLNPTEAH